MSSSVLPFVRGVDFSRLKFKDGQLQEKATEMTNLQWLRLNKTALTGLPDTIDKFSKLEILSVSHNDLTELHSGNIPSIQSLRVLKANHNSVRDSGIPSDLFKIRELVTVDLSHNSLSRLPEDLVQAANLIVLSLSHNNISSVPGALFVHCSGLQHLDLSNNELQSLPPQVRRLEHLQYLDLSNNPLRHYTFKNLDKLANLVTLRLANTGRDFNNTPHIDKLVHLTEIDMSHNDLTRIPEPVYLLEGLLRVNMSHNLIKELSSLIDTWEKLVTLDVSFNQITALHPNICKCTKLKRLFLSNNKLTFEGIPPAIGKLSALEHFIAPRNNLECIPEGICRIYSLKKLVLTSNSLLTLPEGIHFIKLEKLDIRDNPKLVLPPKPKEQVKGSGAEWYNIDFDPEILKKGAVVATSKVLKGAYTRQKERRLRMMSSHGKNKDEDGAAAQKVLKGLVDVAENRDVLLAGAAVEVIPDDMETPSSPVKQKRWDQMLKRPDLDYSDLFAEDVGKLPGIAVWQIENFYPVEVEEAFFGQLYMGDCYIVLKTDWNDNSELDWKIYFWIGRDSTLDKRACSAMHAVHLRNMLSSEHRTHREEQGEESDEFLGLFTDPVMYIEGGTASGFFTVEEDDTPIRLFQLCGNKRPFLEPVETCPSSLDLGHVFVLDAGKRLYVWCGNKSSLMARSKARLICEKINKYERKNKATIYQLRPGLETEEFWEYLGGEPDEEPSLRGPHSDRPVYTPVVYKAGLGTGYLELPQVELPGGRLERAILKTNDVYILDFHTDIFVWIGRKSPRLVRAAALKLAEELQDMIARPPVAIVTRTQEGTEHQILKHRFADWEDVMKVDFTKTTRMIEERQKELKKNPDKPPEKKAAKVDLSPLFLPRELPMPNREANGLAMKWGEQLQRMICCIIKGRKFAILPNREKGHFYSGECYFFLCKYVTLIEEMERDVEDEDMDDTEDEYETSTVIYFWQGKDCNNMGWLTFTHGIKKQLERAMESLDWGMDGPVDVVKLYQQQEDMKFLSHFGGKFIVHWGKRSAEDSDYNPSLYQIRSNGSKLCRRIVQVPATPQPLNSAFCHILKVPFENSGSGIVYIWIGNKTTQEEAIHAEQMGRTMFESNYSNVVVREGAEPENFFWVALGGRSLYDSDADFMDHKRLFRCSNERGFFAVSEKCIDFCQGDLSEDDVMILDSGTNVFLWFGKNASEVERKLSVKSAQVYIKHLISEGLGNGRKLKVAKRGEEPWEFTKCFQGWVTESEA